MILQNNNSEIFLANLYNKSKIKTIFTKYSCSHTEINLIIREFDNREFDNREFENGMYHKIN